MEHEQVEQEVARKSAFIYLPITLGAVLLFWLAASLGDCPRCPDWRDNLGLAAHADCDDAAGDGSGQAPG